LLKANPKNEEKKMTTNQKQNKAYKQNENYNDDLFLDDEFEEEIDYEEDWVFSGNVENLYGKNGYGSQTAQNNLAKSFANGFN
jgi:hypothetical protein